MKTISKGEWSLLLSMVGYGILLAIFSFDGIELNELFFFLAIPPMVASIIFGISAWKSKENGPLKYLGVLMSLFFLLGISLFRLFLGMEFAP